MQCVCVWTLGRIKARYSLATYTEFDAVAREVCVVYMYTLYKCVRYILFNFILFIYKKKTK